MVRWNSAKEGKILASLFENGIANPKFNKAADIDPIKEAKDEFRLFTSVQFRNNYRKTARDWISGKAAEGARRKQLLESEDKKHKSNEKELKEEEISVEDLEDDIEIIEEEPTEPNLAMPFQDEEKPKPNETVFCPRFISHIYPAKNYWREQILIETPSSFTGEEGSFEVGIEENDTQFVFKIPPNDVLIDPHALHAYQSAVYGRNFGDDSAKARAFKDATRGSREKWATFRHNLKFKATKSNDLGAVPWIDFAVLESEGVKTAVLIVELKSIDPIEDDPTPRKVSKGLTMNTFTSPSKMKGVDFASGSTAQEALFIEHLIKRGFKLSDIQNATKRGGVDVDTVMEEGNESEYEDCLPKKQRSS